MCEGYYPEFRLIASKLVMWLKGVVKQGELVSSEQMLEQLKFQNIKEVGEQKDILRLAAEDWNDYVGRLNFADEHFARALLAAEIIEETIDDLSFTPITTERYHHVALNAGSDHCH